MKSLVKERVLVINHLNSLLENKVQLFHPSLIARDTGVDEELVLTILKSMVGEYFLAPAVVSLHGSTGHICWQGLEEEVPTEYDTACPECEERFEDCSKSYSFRATRLWAERVQSSSDTTHTIIHYINFAILIAFGIYLLFK